MANETKGPRPWTVGNKSRTGMSKPKGSGRTPSELAPGDYTTNFTFRIPQSELSQWRALGKEMKLPVGSLVRNAMRDYIEDLTNG